MSCFKGGKESSDDAHSAEDCVECSVQERRAMAIYYTKDQRPLKCVCPSHTLLLCCTTAPPHHRTGYYLIDGAAGVSTRLHSALAPARSRLSRSQRSLSYPSVRSVHSVGGLLRTRKVLITASESENPHSGAHLCLSSSTTGFSNRPGLTSQPSMGASQAGHVPSKPPITAFITSASYDCTL